MTNSGFRGTPLTLRQTTPLPRPAVGADDPQMWLWSAERLFYGGQQVWALAAAQWPTPKAERHPAAPGQFGTAFLLFGYGFENALKGLIVHREVSAGRTVLNGRKLKRGILRTDHNLVELAKSAHVAMSAADKNLLDRLREHVEWAGRYPVMLDASAFAPGDLVPHASLHPETDLALVQQTFERVVSLYDKRYVRLAAM